MDGALITLLFGPCGITRHPGIQHHTPQRGPSDPMAILQSCRGREGP